MHGVDRHRVGSHGMSGSWTLTLRQQPSLRLDGRVLTPTALTGLDAAAIERLPIQQGRHTLALAEFFDVRADSAASAGSSDAAPRLVVQGDLSRVDHIGLAMTGGELIVDGDVGHHLGTAQSGGHIEVRGNAGDLAGAERSGGNLTVHGNVADYAGGALPGSMDGMRGGVFIVRGRAGDRVGDRMRRGSLIVLGDAGDFAASRLVAGTLVVGGKLGAHPAWRMRRGTLICAGVRPELGAGHVAVPGDCSVFWQLLTRDIARLAGPNSPLADLPGRRHTRRAGDLAVDGKGEVFALLD
jgi:formylmethanofuran dehydrogenase subunit C